MLQVECQHGRSYFVHRYGWREHGPCVLGLLRYHPRGEHCVVSLASLDSIIWAYRLAYDNFFVRHLSLRRSQSHTERCRRYSFGYWGNLLVVVFSMVSTTGWNAINSISGASVLTALSDGKCPQWAGVLIICTTVWIICVLGISWIHRLDAFLWISPFVVWCVAAGTGAKDFHGDAVKSPTGSNGAAAALSFMAVVFSFAVSWINCAADYNVKMPVNTPRYKIFWATYAGICKYSSE